jgi:chromosome segregation ATPase
MGGQVAVMRGELGDLRGQITDLRGQVAEVRGQFGDMGGQVADMRGQLGNLTGQVADMRGQLAEMGRRLADTGNQIAELRREMLGHFDDIYRRFERLEQEYQAITHALRRIEVGLADERGRREILERDLGELKQRVAALQTRIEDIEQRLGH